MSRPVDRVSPAVYPRRRRRGSPPAKQALLDRPERDHRRRARVARLLRDPRARPDPALNGDAAYYHWEANLVAKGFGFIDPTRYELFGLKTPSAGHPPAYMLYLAGVSRFIGTSELTHRLASTLLGAGAVFMIGVLARRIFGNDWAGWTAAIFAAAYAHLWINDEMLMSESMYVLTTALAVLAAYRFWDAPRTHRGAHGSRHRARRAEPGRSGEPVPVPRHPVRDPRDPATSNGIQWKRGVKCALTACVAGGLLMLPWVAYNLTRFEHPVYVSNGVGSVLMTANCDSTVPRARPGPGRTGAPTTARTSATGRSTARRAQREVRQVLPAEARRVPEGAARRHPRHRHQLLRRRIDPRGRVARGRHRRDQGPPQPDAVDGRAARRAHVGLLPARARTSSLNGLLEGRGGWQSRLATIEYYPLLALSLVGLVLLRRRRVPILPFLAIAATITITAATSFGITRYRAPVDAMLPVLGGALVWAVEPAWASATSGSTPAVMSEYAATSELLAAHLNAARFGNPGFLDWFYGANPRGRAIVEDIDDDHGRRIGHYGVLPTTFRTPGRRRRSSSRRTSRPIRARRKGLFRRWPNGSTRASRRSARPAWPARRTPPRRWWSWSGSAGAAWARCRRWSRSASPAAHANDIKSMPLPGRRRAERSWRPISTGYPCATGCSRGRPTSCAGGSRFKHFCLPLSAHTNGARRRSNVPGNFEVLLE